jgi:hypothetical protein
MIGLPTLRALDGAQSARMETAAKPETAIDKGMAGPGLLAYIVTSKFSDYLPLYRLEDIFERQGFEISRATQSVWCGDVADLVEPLYELMAERVRASHVVATDDTIMPMLSKGKAANARMWVYVGDDAYPYNVFDFTLDRGATDQSIFPRITDRFCWPMPTAGTTASWQATRLRAPDAGRTCVAA